MSIKAVAQMFKDKNISFGGLQKRVIGEVKTMGPASGGKGRLRILQDMWKVRNSYRKPDWYVFTF